MEKEKIIQKQQYEQEVFFSAGLESQCEFNFYFRRMYKTMTRNKELLNSKWS